MRVAIILDASESEAHRERQARIPEMLDPDPIQRAVARAIDDGLYFAGCGSIEQDDPRRMVEAIDLYETLPGPEHEPPRVRYLYTPIGEGF